MDSYVLSVIDHPNIVSFVGYSQSPALLIIMEFVNGGSVMDLIERQHQAHFSSSRKRLAMETAAIEREGSLSNSLAWQRSSLKSGIGSLKVKDKTLGTEVILDMLCGIAEGLAHLHHQDPPVIHRDMKSENILLVKKTFEPKICDLGEARFVADSSVASKMTVLGTQGKA